ncbi:FAD/NAD(P)-binding domain-containing protein [Basidiobolus meristosporus CBS 931.73]|uniref:FAD/NAD(P)-binding domain-containing protein n=1 Tax=Basidiobolus meristosporus CBS 931.73 TaxID=1314790 RepID=A0A1Y1YSC7_9FUNG|nr:FAD/NAD(P)-binding domain-containing protein [Basidiobolus meristosporus CBS 931.73]|eukprot:ORY00933.1 FAD/NAD(P)-binding domain-containing protein [Basidiobolus meristosporus CBS 931.73]
MKFWLAQLLLAAHVVNVAAVRKVAIIGGGAGGTSAAYFLSRYNLNLTRCLPTSPVESCELNEPLFDIELYEKRTSLGGRVQTINFQGTTVDVGASIFVTANRHLRTLAEAFNLKLQGPTLANGIKPLLAIWDGAEFTYREASFMYHPKNWWEKAKLIWRYGLPSLMKVESTTQETIKKFEKIYDLLEEYQWETVEGILSRLELISLTEKSLLDYLVNDRGINKKLVEEFLAIASRVNYAQDVYNIHGLAGMISLAPTSKGQTIYRIDGGNNRFFVEMAKRSGANLLLNSAVKKITKVSTTNSASNPPTVCDFSLLRVQLAVEQENWMTSSNSCSSRASDKYVVHTSSGAKEYDSVIIATPLDLSDIELDLGPDRELIIPPVEYQTLHVTFVQGILNYTYFNFGENDILPTSIYTIPGHQPPFISISVLNRTTANSSFKLFSYEKLSSETLDTLFYFWDKSTILEKNWKAYPKMTPRNAIGSDHVHKVELDSTSVGGLYYVNGFEPFISTMETETISAKNIIHKIRGKFRYSAE